MARMVYSATATSHQHSGSCDCFCQQSFFIYNLRNPEKGELKTSRNAFPGLPPALPVSRLTLCSGSSDPLSAFPVFPYQHHPVNPAPACLPWAGGSELPAQGVTPVPPSGKKTTLALILSVMKCITKPSGLRPKITNVTQNTSLLYTYSWVYA